MKKTRNPPEWESAPDCWAAGVNGARRCQPFIGASMRGIAIVVLIALALIAVALTMLAGFGVIIFA